MLKKNLIFRYLFVSIFVASIALIAMNYYKNRLISQEHTKTLQKLNYLYKESLSSNKQIAEIVFFNNLLYNETVDTLYKKVLSNTQKELYKEQLYEHLKDYFYYYKSFGVESINFYLPNNELLLNMKHNSLEGSLGNQESLNYVNTLQKEIESIEITQNDAAYVVIKPFFDKQLRHLGAIEIEFNFDHLAQQIEKNIEYDLFFVHKKNKLETNAAINEEEFNSFDLNKEYYLKNSVINEFKYTKEVFKQISEDNQTLLNFNMLQSKEFVLDVFNDNQYQMMAFVPLFNTLTKEHNSYMLAIGNSKFSNISSINQIINYTMILLGSFFLIVFILIYNIHCYKEKNRTIIKKHADLLSAIDKYIIMIETDTSGLIKEATQAFCDLSGYSKKEITGKSINIIRHPDMSKKFFENMWSELNKNNYWEGEIKNIDKNGNSYWVKGIIFHQYDINNNLIGYASIRVNITDTKQLKKINNLLKEDLSNKLNEIKMRDESLADTTKIMIMGKILDSLSHQWKKPMSTISIELANLKARVLSEKLDSEQLLIIHDKVACELKTLSITLNEFITFFSHSNKGDKYNVYSVLQDVVSLMQPQCELHHISLSIECSQDIYCYGVFNELKQTMINLLKHTTEQLISNEVEKPFIELCVVEKGEDIIIECHDNVQGESKNIIEKVFSSNYEEEVFKDAGLNLYVAKLLLEKSGAKFWFENRKENSIFFIKLVSKERRKDRRE